MTNAQIASTFATIAKILELKGENMFRVRAYQRAEMMIGSLSKDLKNIYDEKGIEGLQELPGIGQDLSLKIEELLKTGKLKYLKELSKDIPEGLLEIMQVPGMGPKKTKFVWDTFKVKNIADLKKLAESGKLTDLKGWGEKSVENILKGIETKKSLGDRMRLDVALQLAESLVDILKRHPACKRIEIAGSLRRRRETIGDIDLLVTSTQPEQIMDVLAVSKLTKEVIGRGDTKISIRLHNGIQADLRVVEDDVFGAALHYFTGSKDHNVHIRSLAQKKGVTISEYGVHEGTPEKKGKRIAARTEEDIFKTVGLPYIEPELREDRGEIEAAMSGTLPTLIEEKDLRGDVHMHSDFSDGGATMIEMAKAAKKRGLDYIAITDHGSAMGMVRGLKKDNIKEYLGLIEKARKAVPGLHIFAGVEVDIEEDGSLYLPDSVLSQLDWVVASIHGKFNMPREAMTKRLLTAIRHPSVCLLAHPTARMVLERPGIDYDTDAVFTAAREHGVALEINASPYRLDLSDVLCKRAKELGCKVCIDSDAHKSIELDYRFGISQARRGWITKQDVINCLTQERFMDWLEA